MDILFCKGVLIGLEIGLHELIIKYVINRPYKVIPKTVIIILNNM